MTFATTPVTEMTEQLLKKALTVFTKTKHETTKARHGSGFITYCNNAVCEFTNLKTEIHLSVASECVWSSAMELQLWDVLSGDATSWCDGKMSLKGATELHNST